MAGRVSAFALLELQPGADGKAIEQAYKRLIKQHHPDRAGGDAERAAEITRAYRELRGGRAAADPLQFNQFVDYGRRRARWPLAAMVGGAGVAGLLALTGPSVPGSSFWTASAHLPAIATRLPKNTTLDRIDGALHEKDIDAAVGEAVRLFRGKNELALANASRTCQRDFRDLPGTRMLDRCAALDDAIIGLQNRDPLRDTGPFAPLAVTGRQWSAASELSDDVLAIDSRLDQVRLRVELTLAPQVPAVAPPTTNQY